MPQNTNNLRVILSDIYPNIGCENDDAILEILIRTPTSPKDMLNLSAISGIIGSAKPP